MLKSIVFGLVILGGCVGCTATSSSENHAVVSKPPALGTEEWLVWVEGQVITGDGAGHGPDYGSQEWCNVIENKLFANKSGLKPCSNEWDQKVTMVLESKTPSS